MKQFIFLFVSIFAAIHCNPTNKMHEWSLYKVQHSKNYQNDTEDHCRMEIFFKNKDEIDKHNQMYVNGSVTYRLNVNSYTDLLPTEYASLMKGLRHSPGRKQNSTTENDSVLLELASTALPKSVDWRKRGAVTEVKKQSKCGACWAFSVTGVLEGQYFLKTGHLVSLSEQNLVDCSIDKGEVTCDGNSRHDAFDYIKKNGGIDTEKSYPYKGVGGKCKYNRKKKAGVRVKGDKDLPEGDEHKLQQAIANVGPISVCVDSSHKSFQFYSSGIYYEPKCNPDKTDHAVLAVGYGTDSHGKDYYILKNSWGKDWGEKGYMKIARNRHNHCGIASEATYPIISVN